MSWLQMFPSVFSSVFLFALSLSPDASAGYADASGGLPTYADRETFLWTNAVRIDPGAFQSAYPCSFSSFSATERSSQAPLIFEPGLAEAASYHSDDMEAAGELNHSSSDGTSWDDRLGRYYSGGYIGENIAWGYGSPYEAVIEGWMCSDGHRANIMNPGFTELGTGVAGVYYTQDFGGGNPPNRGMAMGLHQPKDPSVEAELVVDWNAPSAPDAIYAVIGGASLSGGDAVRIDLTRTFGSDERGLYSATVPASAWPDPDCQSYYFVATLGAATETWPEDGSYGFGDCPWDDAPARWLDQQLALATETETDPGTQGTETDETDGTDTEDPGDEPDEDETSDPDDDDDPLDEDKDQDSVPVPGGCGCDGTGSPPHLGLSLLALGLLARSRRRWDH